MLRQSFASMTHAAALVVLSLGCIAPAVGQDGYEPDNVWTSANWIVDNGARQRHTVEPVADADWIRFNAVAGHDYVIETHRAAGFWWCDTVIGLYGPTGSYITHDNDSGDGGFSRIAWTCPTGGTYYVATHEGGHDATGVYDVSIACRQAGDAFEDDDILADAKWITWEGTKYRHSFQPALEGDFHKFAATAGTQYVMETFEVAGVTVDTILLLGAVSSPTTIAEDDNGGEGLCSRIVWTCSTSDIYAIAIGEKGFDETGLYDVSVTAIGNADLRVTVFGVSPSPSALGTMLTCSIGIQNNGSSAAGAFKADVWYHRLDPVFVGSGGYSQRLDVPGLGAGLTFSTSATFTPSFPGNRRARILADSLNSVAEADEWNNTAYKDYVITPAAADLVVKTLTVSPNPSTLGTLLTCEFAATNQGASPTGGFGLRVWAHRDAAPVVGSGGATWTRGYVGLGPGGTTPTATETFSPSYAGTRTARALVDAFGQVKETNEGNNTAAYTYTISSAGLPDLVPTSLTVTPTPSVLGTALTWSGSVKNNGPGLVGTFRIAGWRHRPAPPVYGTWGDYNWDIPALVEGATATRTGTFMPSYTGARRAWMYADVLRHIPESNEANNVVYCDYQIVGALPDLVVSWLDVDPDPATVGEEVDYTVVVQNAGNGPAGPFAVDLWFHRATAPSIGSAGYNQRWTFGGLNPGQSEGATVSYTPSAEGSRKARALADSLDQVTESNEDNNRGSESYYINPVSGSGAASRGRPIME